jgi:predicted Zn-dependent protease with MMP-like domain
MQREAFEQLVQEAWLRIPKRFRQRVHNVGIVVEEEPSWQLLRSSGVPAGHTLLGLYQGVPLTQRTSAYGMVLPDKISLFQGPIERSARHPEEVPEIVYHTLWHEIAHYFGMDEAQVRASERRRGHLR